MKDFLCSMIVTRTIAASALSAVSIFSFSCTENQPMDEYPSRWTQNCIPTIARVFVNCHHTSHIFHFSNSGHLLVGGRGEADSGVPEHSTLDQLHSRGHPGRKSDLWNRSLASDWGLEQTGAGSDKDAGSSTLQVGQFGATFCLINSRSL